MRDGNKIKHESIQSKLTAIEEERKKGAHDRVGTEQ